MILVGSKIKVKHCDSAAPVWRGRIGIVKESGTSSSGEFVIVVLEGEKYTDLLFEHEVDVVWSPPPPEPEYKRCKCRHCESITSNKAMMKCGHEDYICCEHRIAGLVSNCTKCKKGKKRDLSGEFFTGAAGTIYPRCPCGHVVYNRAWCHWCGRYV